MFYIKQNNNIVKSGVFLLPILLSVFAAFRSSYIIFACSLITMFILIRIMPFCKGYEIIWTFLLCFIMCFPADIIALIRLDLMEFLEYERTYMKIVIGSTGLLIALTIEEILTCVISTLLFGKNYSNRRNCDDIKK